PLDQLAFAVRLSENDRMPLRFGSGGSHFADLGQRGAAIDFRLPGADQIEIRAVQDIYRLSAAFGCLGFPDQGNSGRWAGRVIMGHRGRAKHTLSRVVMGLRVIVNGEERRFETQMSIRGVLATLGLDPAKIAVERNLEFV